MNFSCNVYPGTMIALSGFKLKEVILLVNKFNCVLSNINSQNQIVIGGYELKLNLLVKFLSLVGVKSYLLKVSGNFHSSKMIHTGLLIFYFLKRFRLKNLKVIVLSNLTGYSYSDNTSNSLISKQVFKTVNFLANIVFTLYSNRTDIVEVGYGKIISNLIGKVSTSLKRGPFITLFISQTSSVKHLPQI
jgi:[acyl-carrier-protein] S-malonyltransferase